MYLIYMYKEDLALNNLQWLICHKTKASWNRIFATLRLVPKSLEKKSGEIENQKKNWANPDYNTVKIH